MCQYTLPQLSKCMETEVHPHTSFDSHLLDQAYQDLYEEE
jgi:hypothetical protein